VIQLQKREARQPQAIAQQMTLGNTKLMAES
jgi:hypothetical protein